MPDTQRTAAAWILGTFFGVGLLGPGSGTYAAVAVVAIWLVFAQILSYSALTILTLAAAVIATIVGLWAAGVMCRESGKNDPSEVVLDEVAGQLFALVAAPLHWKYALVGLILFRALDIWKPPPVGTLERLHGGAGVMLDDVAAGIITCGALQLLLRLPLG